MGIIKPSVALLVCTLLGRCSCVIQSDVAKTEKTALSFSTSSLTTELYSYQEVRLLFSKPVEYPATLVFTYQIGDQISTSAGDLAVINTLPAVNVTKNTTQVKLLIYGVKAGTVVLGVNSSSPQFKKLQNSYLSISVLHSLPLDVINTIIGWLYVVAWSVSFYPQVYINWKRQSVIGLSFDYEAYNEIGYVAYSIYNLGMIASQEVMTQYQQVHPHGVNPVQISDVVFSLHAFVITLITIIQCFIYERGNQRISTLCWILMAGMTLFAVISVILAAVFVITWLNFLIWVSYIKLFVTVVKYSPQVWMNYKRQSTEGWSISAVLLDFAGGVLSVLQMIFIAFNSDDWGSLFGDPTKFWLGVLSVFYNIIFVVQHYCLYRHKNPYIIIKEGNCK